MEDPMFSGQRQVTDMQDMETQASPSAISVRQSDLKIVIDDFPEDLMKPAQSVKAKENILFITKMVEKIKSLARKKKVKGDITEYNTCHSCRGLLDRNLLICCSQPECQRFFCFRCLNKRFNQTPQIIYEITISSTWGCVSCKGFCNCKICKGRNLGKTKAYPSQLTRFEKSKKKHTDFPLKVETDNDSDRNAIKREFIDDASSFRVPTVVSPVYSYPEDRVPTPRSDRVQQDLINFQVYPKTKLRSRAIAKSLVSSKSQRGDKDDSSSDDESVSQAPARSLASDDVRRSQKITRNARGKAKEECHMCQKLVPSTSTANCSVDQCHKSYCIDCIHETYQIDFDLGGYNPEYWICYSCGGNCECAKCKRRRNTGRRKKDLMINEELLSIPQAKKVAKVTEKRRIKYYDTLTDDEEEEQRQNGATEVFQISSFEEKYRGNYQEKQVKTTMGSIIETPSQPEETIQVSAVEQPHKKPSDENIKKPTIKIHRPKPEENGVEKAKSNEKDGSKNKYLLKKKRLRKFPAMDKEDVDDSKIISETSIDYACITMYDAENEDELRKDVQQKFDN